MKKYAMILASGLFFGVQCYAAEKHENGWIYPMDRQPTTSEWNSWHSYATHVGHDYSNNAGQPVRAVANGWIEDWNDNLPYYGSRTGAAGGAVLIKHESSEGTIFYAVYGHNYIVDSFKEIGKEVKAGDIVAYTHKFYSVTGSRADHIHFGIRPNEKECCGKQFRGFSSDGNDHGWVDPRHLLQTHSPEPTTISQEICGQDSCLVDSQTFSNGDKVGWYPQGNCDEATKWFGLTEVDGNYIPSSSLQPGDVCICR